MENIKNYTVTFFSSDEYPKTKNISAEDALKIMKAIDSDKKHIIVGGEMFAVHQITSITRNFQAEADELWDKRLTENERLSLDVRNLKHGNVLISKQIKKIADNKSMPEIHGSYENPED